eukprot:m.1760 g.1760  ORF g.1760 m.1760 type:complete len:154 (+) comp7804_c0_seq1:981-1442(+)
MAKAALRKNLTPHEQIAFQFQQLRSEQQSLNNKIAEMDSEAAEHHAVIDALKDLDPTRRCFRSVGGVLVERTISDVLPDLLANYEKISDVVSTLKAKYEEKSRDLQEFKEKNNVRIRGEDFDEDEDGPKPTAGKEEVPHGKDSGETVGVLVGK